MILIILIWSHIKVWDPSYNKGRQLSDMETSINSLKFSISLTVGSFLLDLFCSFMHLLIQQMFTDSLSLRNSILIYNIMINKKNINREDNLGE